MHDPALGIEADVFVSMWRARVTEWTWALSCEVWLKVREVRRSSEELFGWSGGATVRYALHRLLAQKCVRDMRGLEPSGVAWHAEASIDDPVLKGRQMFLSSVQQPVPARGRHRHGAHA